MEAASMRPMKTLHPGPIPDSYWVEPGSLVAGEYPRNKDDASSPAKLRRLLEAGITLFLDLTEPGESGLKPYGQLLRGEAARLGGKACHRRFAIQDMGTASPAIMTRILDEIDAAVGQGYVVYLHCYGGIGRTGTVVGCYLVRHGMTGDAALARIASLRAATPDGWRVSPETNEQRQMVLGWRAGR